MNKIDLVIPTYNRPEFLQRILDYYLPYNKEFSFIVADSSLPINKKRNKKIINEHSKMDILYLDKYPHTLSQHDKFSEMVKHITSKYCVFCADDDFIVPSGIKDCLTFLRKNPDYIAAHGTYISFYFYQNLFRQKQFLWRYLYDHKSITSSNPSARVASHFENYTLVLWAVSKTDVIKAIYKEYSKVNIDPYLLPVYGELLPNSLTVAYGKVKRVSTFYSARQCFSQILSYYPSLIDAKKKGIYDQEYKKFKRCLLNTVGKIDTKALDGASTLIDAAFETYQKSGYQQHLMGKINAFLKHTPKIVQNSFNYMHIKYLFSKEKKDRIGLVDRPSSKYYKDFKEIRNCVINH